MEMKPLLPLLIAGLALANPISIREVLSGCPEVGGQVICRVRNGYTLKFDTLVNRTPRVWAPDGHFLFPLFLNLPGPPVVYAADIAPDTDGSFVAAVEGTSADLRHLERSALAFFDANGVQLSTIDTGSWSPTRVVFDADHAVWALGSQQSKEDYDIVRKYARNGELLGAFLARSTFPKGLSPAGDAGGVATRILASADRVAVVAYSGMNGMLRELIELDSAGKVLGRMRPEPAQVHEYTFTTQGIYGSGDRDRARILRLYDPIAGSTRELTDAPPGYVVAADGDQLIYRTVKDEQIALHWIAPPTE
jgi:hypothetical protein